MNRSFREISGILEHPDSAAGSLAATISIDELVVRLEGLPDKLHQRITDKYSVYVTDNSAAPTHSARIGSGETSYLPLSEDGYLRVEEEFDDGGLTLVSHNFAAAATADLSRGGVLLSDPEDTVHAAVCIENYLLRIFAGLALRAGGFFLHSCGIENGGEAYVFFGYSGMGKSAVATLTPGLPVLSDDMIYIVPKEGRFMAASTPFWGALTQLTKERLVLPVAGCYRIRKTTCTKCVEIGSARALGLMVPCCPFVAGKERRDSMLVPNILKFLAEVSVHELFLPLEPEFWKLIKRGGTS